MVGADLEGGHSRDVGRRPVFQMLVEEREEHVLPEPFAGVRAPVERTERARRAIGFAVVPRAEHEMRLAAVAGLDGVEHRRSAVNVLLVPFAADDQGWDAERRSSEDPVDRLILPIFVIVGMLGKPLPEGQLVHPHRVAVGGRRAVAKEGA